ncbi:MULTISPECIES: putative quinol monooxygenase [Dickeya]|uniref:Antibiotic biosynthesis monooxygenase n=1 Tax=Dickeya zeae (strain Ech586) TaxID=590409 RepID=D2BXI9_DICZ5|nr:MULTISPECIES: putative quinol monooxygenase [Dickeya]ACZ76443.1 Antibiotic biosynthesis monooxygenase [Dickeya parazeae Ech586]MBP2835943.1 antibiotic biosynthesis monooxygenase [Dickeya parazeae]UCZ74767.1 antibiotic biosynthesis monooxygenase [Dickeya zeae]
MEIRIVASVQAKPEFINDVAAAVRQVVAPSRQEEGNLQYELHEELNKSGSFVFFERWKSRQAISEHEQTAHFRAFVAQLEGKVESMDIKLLQPVA